MSLARCFTELFSPIVPSMKLSHIYYHGGYVAGDLALMRWIYIQHFSMCFIEPSVFGPSWALLSRYCHHPYYTLSDVVRLFVWRHYILFVQKRQQTTWSSGQDFCAEDNSTLLPLIPCTSMTLSFLSLSGTLIKRYPLLLHLQQIFLSLLGGTQLAFVMIALASGVPGGGCARPYWFQNCA